jgi:hypothetical protein
MCDTVSGQSVQNDGLFYGDQGHHAIASAAYTLGHVAEMESHEELRVT